MAVLVGYASAHGSTREIAERIGALLTKASCPADVQSADGSTNCEGYSARELVPKGLEQA
jgi:menaquinone-dependent protoporphyrinogen oxidase